jgi:hypothetical protein
MDDVVLTSAREALDLATTATQFDRQHNYLPAIDYYDKAILSLDEVIVNLTTDSAESRLLLSRRAMYEGRMELLIAAVSGSASTQPPPPQHRPHSTSQVPVALLRSQFEEPPTSLVAVPYWQLRVIKRTLEYEHGGMLTPLLVFPRAAWYQSNIKFSGLTVKLAAFHDIISTINTTVGSLDWSGGGGKVELRRLAVALVGVHKDFCGLQKQLARSFSYLGAGTDGGGIEGDEEEGEGGGGGGGVEGQGLGQGQVQDGGVEGDGYGGEEDEGEAGKTAAHALLFGLGRLTTGLGRRVRKTLETGMHRFSALPSAVSDEEFVNYTLVVANLCDKAQLLDALYQRLDANRGADPEDCLTSLCHIAAFMRDVVVKLLLHDMQLLLERFMTKERKNLLVLDLFEEVGGD